MNHRRHSGYLLFSLFLLTLALTACGSTPPTAAPLPPLRIGYTQWAGYATLNIADQEGFFQKEGVKVDLVLYNSIDVGSEDFVAQKLDGYMTTLTDSVAEAATGLPVQVVWVCDNSLGGDVVVGNSQIASPADLKGKRIGLSYGTFSHIFVLRGLAKYGLSESDVTIVNIDAKDIPAALASGQIDAGHTWGPYVTQAKQGGAKVLFTSADTPGVIVDVLNIHSPLADKRSDDMKAVIRALADAVEFWQKNPDEGNKIVAKAIGDTPENMPNTLNGVRIFNLADNVDAFKPTSSTVRSLFEGAQITADFFLSKNIIKKAPDFRSMINPTFVQAASDQQKAAKP